MQRNQRARSEVADILSQIRAEYASGMLGLSGFSSGAARHDFITARMERMGQLHRELGQLVGEEDAIALVVYTLEHGSDSSNYPTLSAS